MTNLSNTFSSRRPTRRIRDLDGVEWLMLAETLVTLAGASVAIALLPFRKVVQLASRDWLVRRAGRFGSDELIWAVEAIARRVPWRTVCFQKGLALHLMQRRRGILSVLHYGVGKGDAGELAAHVWISVDKRIVMGGDVADRFNCLATYPAQT